ncbi:MAG: DUF222 domain-containing protein [Rhodococcus sp. (in: high G+C Gram-positive bacteria)]
MSSGGGGENAAGHSGVQGGATLHELSDPSLEALVSAHEELMLKLGAYDTSVLPVADLTQLIARMERTTRSLSGFGQTWLHRVVSQRGFQGSGVSDTEALGQLLHLDNRVARRRLAEAEQLAERTCISGEALDPELPCTASALRDGDISTDHVAVVRTFFRNLPTAVDAGTREQAEKQLAGLARQLTPHQLRAVADRLATYICEEGEFTDPKERVRRRAAHLGPQGRDGMSKLTVILDPEGRALVELIFDVLAKPGKKPEERADGQKSDAQESDAQKSDAQGSGAQEPDAQGSGAQEPDAQERDGGSADFAEPSSSADEDSNDLRTGPQRRYDALMTCWRRILALRNLGATHRGVPVSLVFTTTVAALAERAGLVLSATGSVLSVEDLVRIATNNPDIDRYLCVLGDDGRPVYLGRNLRFGRKRRIASPDQRLALFAAEKGCTFPGCSAPATHSQIHHVTDWAKGGLTDIECLTHACERHHQLVHDGPLGWATSVAPPGHRYVGRVLWHPPDVLDPARTGRVNHFFTPEDYLAGGDSP